MRYAIGDIHGCYRTLVKLIEENLKVQKDDELYFVGDYIDRGPESRQVVDYLIERIEQGYQFHLVRGNHEEMLIDAWVNQTPDPFMLWMLNGAEDTLLSYGIDSQRYMDEASLNHLPEEHIDFFRKLPYYIELEDYIIVHAGINFKVEEPFKDTRSMIWCRDCKNDWKQSGNRVVVAGHTPTPLAKIRKRIKKNHPKLLNIDAGCVYSSYQDMGNLAALDLDNLEIYWEENIDL